MRRPPTTFALLFWLLAAALAFTLVLATLLWVQSGRRSAGETYGRLSAALALASDELASHADPASRQTLAALRELGVRVDVSGGPPATARVSPLVRQIGETAGHALGDPSRVLVTRGADSQIWVRSAHDPQLWVVLHAPNHRRQPLRSTLAITALIGLLALIIAALAARRLSRPLEGLARHANDLLAGQPMGETLAGSPREVRALAAAIGAAGARLRDAARERELMLAGISHDLRTPLARLRLALELGDASDDQRREAMVADLQQLDDTLEQCLASVRDGSDEAPREVDIATLVGQLLALREHSDDWQLEGPALLPFTVRPTLLRRAIGNLMDNAERHGAPPFRLSMGCKDEQLLLQVADHGPGVDPALLDRLGQPFLRGDPARGGRGTGLGLSIVKRAAEQHGGSLHLRNGPDGGLLATLAIPLHH